MLRFHNTLTGTTDEFRSIEDGVVRMYNCGPTVYGTQHIGNLSMFVFTDVLRRVLESHGYDVRQVINFTDFGHLTSDADEGEDKMTKGLKAEGLEPTKENMHKLGEKYAGEFLRDIKLLNVKTDGTKFPYASEYVPQQIELIKKLFDNQRAYNIENDGIYFDVAAFSGYGKLGGLTGLSEKIDYQLDLETRIGRNNNKRNQRDFAIWKYGDLGWESPWGKGFPGWHIECSAMILALLGEQIDIHTGGIEHIAVHHNNEIAQSEAATGKSPFSRFWMHRAHLRIDDQKIAKSEGNVVYLSEIIEKGYSPLSLRYFLLGAHYRTPVNFTYEALDGAETALRKLKDFVTNAPEGGKVHARHALEFGEALENDLGTPAALAVVWTMLKDSEVSDADKRATLLDFDRVLGLDLKENEFALTHIPDEVQTLLIEREAARTVSNWAKADELREKIRALGYEVNDTNGGQKLEKI